MPPKRKRKADMQAYPYLTFNGNCRQAMMHYQSCIGGRLRFQTVGSSLPSKGLSAGKSRDVKKMKDCILQATLSKGGLVLLGTDMAPDEGLVKGNSVSILLHCSSKATIKKCFQSLSAGGQIHHPLARNASGALFGVLMDKFGHQWLLYFNNEQKQNK
jgi:PhnB protein